MSSSSWLRACKNALTSSPQGKSRHRTRRQLRPQLEALEDRCVPSVDPLPTDWAGPVGDRTNLYTGLAWHDFTQDTDQQVGTLASLDWAENTAANSTKDGFTDWRLPTKTEAQQAAIND